MHEVFQFIEAHNNDGTMIVFNLKQIKFYRPNDEGMTVLVSDNGLRGTLKESFESFHRRMSKATTIYPGNPDA